MTEAIKQGRTDHDARYARSKSEKEQEEAKAPGNVMVEMHWPNDMPYDVDLWVKAPGELPVGFWNQSGLTFNLLRDDLGVEGDATDRNYEMSYSRGIPSGEYVVNVHMYGHVPRGVRVPVRVRMRVRVRGWPRDHIVLERLNINLVRR